MSRHWHCHSGALSHTMCVNEFLLKPFKSHAYLLKAMVKRGTHVLTDGRDEEPGKLHHSFWEGNSTKAKEFHVCLFLGVHFTGRLQSLLRGLLAILSGRDCVHASKLR